MNDPLYQTILKRSELIQANPEGLSEHQPPGKTDQIIIKQNNTIILLLLELNNNVQTLIKERVVIKEKIPVVQDTGIDDLVNQLKRIEITPAKDRPIRVKKPWTFFQVGEKDTKKGAIPSSKTT